MKPKLLYAIVLAATISSCKKSETVTGPKTANASQKSVDNTPGCGIDTSGEGIKYITGGRGLVSGNIMVDPNGNVYSTLHLHGPDFNYYKEGVVHLTSDWAGAYAGKMMPGGKFSWLTPLYSFDGNEGIPLGPLPSNYDDQTFYTLPTTTATDANGNFYEMHFEDRDNGYGVLATVHLSKYNSAGALQWAISQFEGYPLYANGILKIDAAGNVYLCGNYSALVQGGTPGIPTLGSSPINFDPSNATSHTLSGTGSFIQELDANGKFVSVTQVNYVLIHFAVDDKEQIYDAGNLYGYGQYVRKIGRGGNLLWQKPLGNFSAMVNTLADGKGNLILWSYAPNYPATSGVAMFDGGGTLKWRYIIKPATQIQSVTTDVLGNIYAIGMFSGTVNFSGSPTPYNLTAGGPSAIFIQKFSPTGQMLWVKQRVIANATNISTAIDSKFLYLQGNTSTTTIFGAKVSLCN